MADGVLDRAFKNAAEARVQLIQNQLNQSKQPLTSDTQLQQQFSHPQTEATQGIVPQALAQGLTHLGETLAFPTEKIPENVVSSLNKTAEALKGINKDFTDLDENEMKDALDTVSGFLPVTMVRAFHGSPFKFKTFDSTKIGTGQGAQTFGHGLYFTEKRDVAKHYARLAESKRGDTGKDIASRLEDGGLNKQQIIKELENRKKGSTNKEFIQRMDDGIEATKRNDLITENVYSVTLHKGKTPEQYDYVDWFKPITDGQRKKIVRHAKQNNLDTFFEDMSGREMDLETFKGSFADMYQMMGNADRVSNRLLDAGIDGIKYPSGTFSGIKGSDKFNYVVFDPNAVTIEAINNAPKGSI